MKIIFAEIMAARTDGFHHQRIANKLMGDPSKPFHFTKLQSFNNDAVGHSQSEMR
jgi:hypothetical protein